MKRADATQFRHSRIDEWPSRTANRKLERCELRARCRKLVERALAVANSLNRGSLLDGEAGPQKLLRIERKVISTKQLEAVTDLT